MNRAFLVGNRRNRYGWLIPACRATSSVEVPASPCLENSAIATSSTISRRSAAGSRCLATRPPAACWPAAGRSVSCLVSVTTPKLVMTHYFVKRLNRLFVMAAGQDCAPAREFPERGRRGGAGLAATRLVALDLSDERLPSGGGEAES